MQTDFSVVLQYLFLKIYLFSCMEIVSGVRYLKMHLSYVAIVTPVLQKHDITVMSLGKCGWRVMYEFVDHLNLWE